MTYTVKIRTLPGSPMLCEYECPEHGCFERVVKRDENGDPHAWVVCGVEVDRDEEMEPDSDLQKVDMGADGVYCGRRATLVIGTTGAGSITRWSANPVALGRASRSDEKDPRALDTEPLATGKMTKDEWRKWQRGISNERRHQRRLKSGRISKRIQVGGDR